MTIVFFCHIILSEKNMDDNSLYVKSSNGVCLKLDRLKPGYIFENEKDLSEKIRNQTLSPNSKDVIEFIEEYKKIAKAFWLKTGDSISKENYEKIVLSFKNVINAAHQTCNVFSSKNYNKYSDFVKCYVKMSEEVSNAKALYDSNRIQKGLREGKFSKEQTK